MPNLKYTHTQMFAKTQTLKTNMNKKKFTLNKYNLDN